MDSVLLGHFRLSQETDNQTKVFAVVCKKKKKEEVRMLLCGVINTYRKQFVAILRRSECSTFTEEAASYFYEYKWCSLKCNVLV